MCFIESTALIEFQGTPVKRVEGVLGSDGGSSSGKVLRSGKVAVARDGLKSALTKLRDNEEGKRTLVKGNGALGGKVGKGKGLDSSSNKVRKLKSVAFLVGEPISDVEAREKWNWRYQLKGDGKEKHVGRILEFFRTTKNEDYFRVQWFYKARDTVMKDMASFHEKKRLFYSTLENNNPLDCLISKVNVIEITREVPNYVFTFEKGKSKRTFARLWWDETVGTVVTFPSCHSMAVLHPEQDRVLTLREFARLQGFPDYYRFCGTVKERYCQVGNAVAVSISRALGHGYPKDGRRWPALETITQILVPST